jgi:hypothetical protein
MLRSLGVPARWVQGYAGGTLDPNTGAYVVKQSIAHSWPEVYFPGYGWQRFEPTPASYVTVPLRPAAPDSQATTGAGDPGALALPDDELRLRQQRFREDDQAASDAALRAQLAAQQAAELRRQILIVVVVLTIMVGGGGLFLLALRRELRGLTPGAMAFARLNRLAAWAGMPQSEDQTPYEYAGELSRNIPEQHEPIQRITGAYVAERYRGDTADSTALEHDWRKVRRALLPQLLGRFLPRPRSSVDRSPSRKR